MTKIWFQSRKTSCFLAILFFMFCSVAYSQNEITPLVSLQDSEAIDQDDMCIWIHPDPTLSTVIGSDKAADKLFVYDLNGNTIQTISVPGEPGNIDVRYNFLLSGQLVDIVGYNDRTNSEVVIYKVNQSDRTLTHVASFDAGNWPSELYGFCLYTSPNTGKHYAIGSGESSQMRQWELVDVGNGTIDGIELRTWFNGSGDLTEGLVADDETAKLYAANEGQGIYKYDADPNDPNPIGQMIAPTDSNGLTQDVEGITLYYAANGQGYLIASSQGSDEFIVFEREAPHHYVTTFMVDGAGDTDGIDVTNVSMGPTFPLGLFAAHSGSRAIRLCDYSDIGINVDTSYWNPRDFGNPTKIKHNSTFPNEFQLNQNYPNPFNPRTRISYNLPQNANVRLLIYDLKGGEVAKLLDGFYHAGSYVYDWRAVNSSGVSLPSGIYFARIDFSPPGESLEVSKYTKIIKMVLIR